MAETTRQIFCIGRDHVDAIHELLEKTYLPDCASISIEASSHREGYRTHRLVHRVIGFCDVGYLAREISSSMASILPFVIRSRLGTGPAFIRRLSAGVLFARRTVLQMISPDSGEKTILLIFGCQRSGTTMLSQIFEGDARVSPFAEHSTALSRNDHEFRWRDLESVSTVFERSRGRLVVAKPLVESQRADEILDHLDTARALWVYRDYRDVVRSYVKLFDRAGVNIARKVITKADNWASERVPEDVRLVFERYYSDDMRLNDAAALFWWMRNGWYLELDLDQHPRIMPCRYESLVFEPDMMMRSIYDFAGLPYPGPHLVAGVHESSTGLGRSIEIDPEIEKLCSDRLGELDRVSRRFTESGTHG